ncbi:iron-containing alcohol dehydrogenase [Phaeovulum vinaykumarii]|uniref:Uncharacterized protein n=1 Tax=Phaeovulum vinaykumarii TaxID=407234 RepID=A0A1N7M9I3_9RHOB|nr:iron-containing alcohol dehydrogenase [Phaeovulum vinaykumarii]SIS82740.1 hypothetical protein SAMN05421795_10695 [Phaeovulum vinaykumarii]SOC10695.1 hypothetical protein SAMN05878426_10695 [Phaeovulum vinaykumarii]
MTSFALRTPTEIRFGRGVAAGAAEAIAAFGPATVLVHGANPARAGWLIDALLARGVAITAISCPAEPDLPMLDDALAAARADAPASVVGLGGGAALDLAKALAALIPAPEGPMAYFEVVGAGKPLAAAPLPFVALPTTAGTGTEVTQNAVIGIPEAGRKVSLRSPAMLARLALVDPALTDHCPRAVTLASGLDALTQVIEPWLSARANSLTDALCEKAIPLGLRALATLMHAEDAQARDDMALTSLFGGLALANAGLGAVHGLAGVLGAETGAAHGAICGALLPHVLAANRTALPNDDMRQLRLATLDGWIARHLWVSPEGLAEWIRDAGLPGLGAMGLRSARIPQVAEASAAASSMKANPVVLPPETLRAILRAAL